MAGDVEEVEALLEQGLALQAYTKALGIGPLATWRGVHSRSVAGRIAWAVGGKELGNALISCAYREDRTAFEGIYRYGSVVQMRSGTLGAWRYHEKNGDFSKAPDKMRADWLARRGAVLASLRDFDRAQALIDQALELDPSSAWLSCEQAHVLREDDRVDEALDWIERALELRPDYRPAVRHKAEMLFERKRSDEAIALLRDVTSRVEAGGLTHSLVRALMDKEDFSTVEGEVARLEELMPLAGVKFVEHLNGLRSDIAYGKGEYSAAIEYAEKAGKGFFEALAANLRDAPEIPKKVQLPVRFVRQDYVTCAPATLTAIAQYWKYEVDHEALAAEICYDGTPDHVERNWAETNGFVAPEFTVTWESAIALLDAGIPFTMTTGGATWAHAQAVIGYDSRRRTLSVLDPGSYNTAEYLGREWLEKHRSFGPRGMLLVPEAEAERIAGIDLPDRPLWDIAYCVKRALHENDRGTAQDAISELREKAPQHALTLLSRLQLSRYDEHYEGSLKCATALLEIYPNEPRFTLSKASLLGAVAKSDTHRAFLREAVEQENADPIFSQNLAQSLMADARCWGEAARLLEKVMRRYGCEPSSLGILAGLREEQNRLDEALEVRRFAACLAPMDEGANYSYFQTARFAGRPEEGLDFLAARVGRLGSQRGAPARTYFEALLAVGRNKEAFKVLSGALKQHPEDLELILFAAREAARFGQREPAKKLLDRAKGKAKHTDWLWTASELARNEGDTLTALELSEERAKLLPFDVDAQRSALQLCAAVRGREPATDYVKGLLERVPNHFPIQRLGIDWLRRDNNEDAAAALNRLLRRNPNYAWAHRELALSHLDAGRVGDAKASAEEGLRLEPMASASHGVMATAYRDQGNYEDALASYRRSIELDVDQASSIVGLLACSRTDKERSVSLAYVEEQLVSQVVYGDGLSGYRSAARSAVEPGDVLVYLRRILKARPDLWHAWSEMTAQQLEMGELDGALKTAQQGAKRFGMNPEAWGDLAGVYKARGEGEMQIKALRRGVALAPTADGMTCVLAEAYQAQGQLEEAQQLLEKAVARAPRDARNRSFLADVFAQSGETERAIDEIEQALRLDPEYDWAWKMHQKLWAKLGQEGASARFARTLAEEHPRESGAWIGLAERLVGAAHLEERLAALDRALEIEPRRESAHDLKATYLAEVGRYEEAIEACRPAIFEDHVPTSLRGRAAWLEAERGNRAEAVKRMREAVADQPTYQWGWSMLQEWALTDEDGDAALEASERLIQLAPRNGDAWWRLCEAHLFSKRREEAKKALRRCLEIEPEHARCAFGLFDVLIEDGERVEARSVLEVLSAHHRGPYATQRAIKLSLAEGSAGEARNLYWDLCVDSGDSTWALRDAYERMVQAGWRDAVLEVLNEAIEDRIASARAALFLGEILESEENTPARLVALKYAHELDPNWDEAARIYGAALHSFGELDESRRVLEAALRADPEDGINLAYLADLVHAQGEVGYAIKLMTNAVRLEPGYDWAWRTLESWTQDRCPNLRRDLAVEIATGRVHDAAAWVSAADSHSPSEREGAISCLDRAIEIEPHRASHHDQKAETLAGLGRFEEALAASRPTYYGKTIPVELQGREAWVVYTSGDVPGGIAAMREIVDAEPNYRFGVVNLVDWYREAGELPAGLALVQAYVGAADPSGADWSWLGDLQVEIEDRAAARASYAKAWDLEPGRQQPALSLFDLHWDSGEVEASEAILEKLHTRIRTEYSIAREIWIHVARKEKTAALGALRELCECSSESNWPLSSAFETLERARWGRKARWELAKVVEEGLAGVHALELFGRIFGPKKSGMVEASFRLRLKEESTSGIVGKAYLSSCPTDRRFRKILSECEDIWRADNELWGMVGSAYVRTGRFGEAIDWLADWGSREQAPIWPLQNLQIAMRATNRWDELAAVCEKGLASESPYQADFTTWSALDHAIAGRLDLCKERLEQFSKLEKADAEDHMVAELCWALVETHEDDYASAVKRLKPALKVMRSRKEDRALLNGFDRAVRAIAKRQGGAGPWLRAKLLRRRARQ